MTLELSQFEVMEYLWDTIDKTPDGAHIRYLPGDIDQLWKMGFVDTKHVDLNKWKRLFEPFKQSDGSFLLGRDDFLSLDAYRYKGEIRIPFDAMKINEGKYTDKGLGELIEASIAPSCNLSPDGLKEFFDTLKKDFRQPDGLILIRRPAKTRIKSLINTHPSPLRNLELMLDRMIRERGAKIGGEIDKSLADSATVKAALQASRFSAAPISAAETKADGLKKIEKVRKMSEPAEIGDVSKVELKKIRRSRKGMRG